ncbi:hypothetical protein OP10G_0299 [Fimbriimonas ginsengisoli Gsoil 348]|uniref:Uncharacterized protein n=1 Tax=Fimbriimonas ginsengisoli Gsoil 348 TaxID=661478 RepID=A0A068NJP1_FIMGI|nr:hypothetical protein OP10G_0299 [Fimbriimonas ginsengisoli Gsoil 348]
MLRLAWEEWNLPSNLAMPWRKLGVYAALPEMRSASVSVRRALGARSFHVGCSGWFYWHWRGSFYRQTTPALLNDPV